MKNEIFKPAKALLLPTNEKAKKGELTMFGGKLIVASSILHLAQVSKHLYILSSDEELKEGDWAYDKVLNEIFQTDKYADFKYMNQTDNVLKIIATTDKSLFIHQKETFTLPERVFYLPQPSESFIEKYVEEYNKGNIITEVMVEYDMMYRDMTGEHKAMMLIGTEYPKLKINPKDNTITIKKVKDTLKDIINKDPDIRNEVRELIIDAFNLGSHETDSTGACDTGKLWEFIDENL